MQSTTFIPKLVFTVSLVSVTAISQADDVEFLIDRQFTLQISALDINGRAIANAQVWANPTSNPHQVYSLGRTDRFGKTRTWKLDLERLNVTVIAEGMETETYRINPNIQKDQRDHVNLNAILFEKGKRPVRATPILKNSCTTCHRQ